jgi:hypothetical protein
MSSINKRASPSKHWLQLKHEDLQQVVNLNNYAKDNAIVLPGQKNFDGRLLPCDKNRGGASPQGIDDNTWYVKHKQHILTVSFTTTVIGTTFIDLAFL